MNSPDDALHLKFESTIVETETERDPVVSVIVPTYSRPKMVTEAVTSVLKQSMCELEVIVVDDHGENEAPTVWSDSRARTIRLDENGGVGAARNFGAKLARGEWLVFLDDDDCLDREHVATLYSIGSRVGAEIVLCWTRRLSGTTHVRRGRKLSGNVYNEILDATTPQLGAVLIRRSHFQPFDESYRACEDLEWWLRVTATSSVATVEEPLYLWRRHDEERSHGARQRIEASRRLLSERDDYFREHPKAEAFRWYRIGIMHEALSEHQEARKAFRYCVMQFSSPWSQRAAIKYLREWRGAAANFRG